MIAFGSVTAIVSAVSSFLSLNVCASDTRTRWWLRQAIHTSWYRCRKEALTRSRNTRKLFDSNMFSEVLAISSYVRLQINDSRTLMLANGPSLFCFWVAVSNGKISNKKTTLLTWHTFVSLSLRRRLFYNTKTIKYQGCRLKTPWVVENLVWKCFGNSCFAVIRR